jgi:histone deacetylase 6
VQSPKSDLSDMLAEHKEQVYQWISDRADLHESDEVEE